MRHTQILAISTLGMLLAIGCTKAETPVDAAVKPVAVVNGTPISRDVWNLYVKTRHGGKTPGDLTADEQKAALDELIGMYVGAQEAEKQKLGAGEPNARLELVGKSAMAELLFKKYTEGAEPTEAELKAEYDARIAEAPKQEYQRAAHPRRRRGEGQGHDRPARQGREFRATREGQLKGRVCDRRRRSRVVQSQSDGKAVLRRLQQLEIGKYTATPVKSEFGWHVIKLEDKRATTPPPYDSVKAQLGPLVNQKKFETHLKELVKAAKVERSL